MCSADRNRCYLRDLSPFEQSTGTEKILLFLLRFTYSINMGEAKKSIYEQILVFADDDRFLHINTFNPSLSLSLSFGLYYNLYSFFSSRRVFLFFVLFDSIESEFVYRLLFVLLKVFQYISVSFLWCARSLFHSFTLRI